MEATILFLVLGMLLLGLNARYNGIIEEKKNWTYFLYRYENYCHTNNIVFDDTLRYHNQITSADILIVLVKFWKRNPQRYFSHKPSFEDIYKLYIRNKL